MNLVKRLFGGSKQDPQPAGTGVSDRIAPHFTAKLDDNRRIYAIGDIHGRLDLLDRLHEQILEDLETAPPGTRSAVVYLGDYIDRGPASRQVIDRLLWDPIAVSECIHLCGNHDDFLLKFLEDPSVGPVWLRNGGDATLASYKVEIQPTEDPAELRRIRDQLQDRLPEGHRDFLRRLRYSYSEGDYFFAHAGVRPVLHQVPGGIQRRLVVEQPDRALMQPSSRSPAAGCSVCSCCTRCPSSRRRAAMCR